MHLLEVMQSINCLEVSSKQHSIRLLLSAAHHDVMTNLVGSALAAHLGIASAGITTMLSCHLLLALCAHVGVPSTGITAVLRGQLLLAGLATLGTTNALALAACTAHDKKNI